MFGETDDVVARKAAALLAVGIRPIVCVGETLAERESGRDRRGARPPSSRRAWRAPRASGTARARDRLRADLGDRHGRDRHPGAGPGDPRLLGRSSRDASVRGWSDPHPVRWFGQARKRPPS